MNIIAYATLREFWKKHPDSEEALRGWYADARAAAWTSSSEIKRQHATASIVTAERVVFNLRGNRYRLVVRINYRSGTVFIRFLGTHAEYDQVDVESV